jgi:hypothetical protein
MRSSLATFAEVAAVAVGTACQAVVDGAAGAAVKGAAVPLVTGAGVNVAAVVGDASVIPADCGFEGIPLATPGSVGSAGSDGRAGGTAAAGCEPGNGGSTGVTAGIDGTLPVVDIAAGW